MKTVTRDDVANKYDDFLNVGKLRKSMEDLPDDTKVVIERVEDFYFEKNGWKVLEESDSFIPDGMRQYFPAWTSWHYNDDKRILFIDAHY